MKLRTALYDGHTELVTQEELEAASTFVGATVGGSAGDLLVSDGVGNAGAFTAGAGEVVFVDGSNHAATSAAFRFDAATDTLNIGADGGAAIWFRDSTIDPAHSRLRMEQLAGNYTLRLSSQDDDGTGAAILQGVGSYNDETDYNGWELTTESDINLLRSRLNGGSLGEAPWRVGTFLNYVSLWTAATNPLGAFDAVGVGTNGNENRFIFKDAFPDVAFYPNTDTGPADLGTVDDPWQTGYFDTSVQTPAISPAAGVTWTLPATNAAGVLTNDGSGNLSWV